jgi:DNA-binding transcriptional LysR family regulator
MDLHQIEIFCMLIKLRSFSGAAGALHLTQPTVSGHIKNLESDLGVMLLDRLGKRVVPTEEERSFTAMDRSSCAPRPRAAGD